MLAAPAAMVKSAQCSDEFVPLFAGVGCPECFQLDVKLTLIDTESPALPRELEHMVLDDIFWMCCL